MKNIRLCVLAFAASLALGTLAKPVLHVLKISSSGDDAAFANTQVITTNAYGYIEWVDEKELKKNAPPKPSWLKELKTKQTFRITLSANTSDDTNKWFTLNVMTITKNKENRKGYGYAEPQSIRCMFLRSGAMDGALKLVYVTPSYGTSWGTSAPAGASTASRANFWTRAAGSSRHGPIRRTGRASSPDSRRSSPIPRRR